MHYQTWTCGFLMACGICLMGGRLVADEPVDSAKVAYFEKRVRPVLVERCLDCHQGPSAENGLEMDTRAGLLAGGLRGPALIPGQPEKSLLIRALRHGELLKMPPKSKLPSSDIATIAKWIADGAIWPNTKGSSKPRVAKRDTSGPGFTKDDLAFWAFQSPTQSPLPDVPEPGAIQSPIDTFIHARLSAQNIAPAPIADKYTLIRRATLNLIGLPPTPEETAAFLADDSPDAFARVVERLLASPHYGERWGRHWLDVIRYADSNGLDENLAYANAFRYRDYVIAAFNSNKRYDRFVQEQIAGDLLSDDGTPHNGFDRIVATGFLSIGPKMLAEDDPLKLRMDIIDEQLDTIGRAFMGLTLGCARCHDHKFDPIPARDYYALAGIFNSTKSMDSYKVVAQWREEPLATPEAIAVRDAHQKKSKALDTEIKKRQMAADLQIQEQAQRHVGDYLLAAETARRRAEMLAILKPQGGQAGIAQRPGVVLLEAENYTRGNVQKDTTSYGVGIGVLVNRGEQPNYVEYDISVSSSATYRLEVRYAAAAARPCKLLVNGQLLRADIAGKVTGSWFPDTQQWHVEGFVDLKSGKNIVRLEHPMFFPHIDKVLLLPAHKSEVETCPPLDPSYKLIGEFVTAWKSLLQSDQSRLPALMAWTTAAQKAQSVSDLRTLAASYQTAVHSQLQKKPQAKTTADSDTAEAPATHQALAALVIADDGPFRSNQSLASYYLESTRKELQALSQRKADIDKSMPKFPQAMAVADDAIQDLRLHYRGSHLTQGPLVPRGFLQIMTTSASPAIPQSHSGRRELVRWMTSDDHPLTARVFVNRIWHWHFGRGLVRSPDNFGRLGERPTHPELLDWLAQRFVDTGWDVKALHRLILLSSTWQMSNQWNAEAAATDPENRLWWRREHKRLEAEAIRDSILQVTGRLDQTMRGSLLPTANRKYVTSTANVDPVVYVTDRRSVYIPVVRSALYDVFQAFDFADPSALNGQRQSTTVAPQALFMMNSQFVSQLTEHAASQILGGQHLDDRSRVTQCYQQIYSRQPTEPELQRSLRFIENYAKKFTAQNSAEPDMGRLRAWQSLLRVLIASNEFVYVN